MLDLGRRRAATPGQVGRRRRGALPQCSRALQGQHRGYAPLLPRRSLARWWQRRQRRWTQDAPAPSPRLKNAEVTDSPAYGQETMLLEGEWIGEIQVLMRLWRSCRTSALALMGYLPARSRSPVAPDAVYRGALPGDAGRSMPGRHSSGHNLCISMQSCIRRSCACNSAEQLLLSTHLLPSCKTCADSSRYSAASKHGVARLKALRDRPDEPSGQHRFL